MNTEIGLEAFARVEASKGIRRLNYHQYGTYGLQKQVRCEYHETVISYLYLVQAALADVYNMYYSKKYLYMTLFDVPKGS